MVQQAIGIEVVIFILWILFSIYGSIQQAKKKKAKEAAGETYEEPVPQEDEDPFKKVMEELLGKREEKQTQKRREIIEPWDTRVEEVKPVYESIPKNYKGSTGTLQSTTEAAKQMSKPPEFTGSTEGNYIDTTYQYITDKEGVPQTFNYEESHKEKAVTRKRIPGTGVIINGKRMLMRDALVAQIILERKS